MEWYNGVKSESVQNRVLYATSPDAATWSAPAVMFNTTGPIGLENEPMVVIKGRRYAIAGARVLAVNIQHHPPDNSWCAGSWDVNARKGGGCEHTGPDTPMMRRVHGPGQLGQVFWLGSEVPSGFEHLGYPTYLNAQSLDKQTRTDAANYLAALLDAESLSDWGKPNERVTYQLPSAPNRLITLLRTGGALPGEPPVGSHMLASTCVLDNSNTLTSPSSRSASLQMKLASTATYHVCRPGTGLWNVVLPGDSMPSHMQASIATPEAPGVGTGGGTNATTRNEPWPGYKPM